MKLRTKILGGFGILLAGGLALSAVSIWVMRSVGGEARVLSEQNMPQTDIASEIERAVVSAVSEMRAYDFSYDETFLAASRKDLQQVKGHVQKAVQLTDRNPELRMLKENAAKAYLRVGEYESLMGEMEKAGKEIHALRKKLDTAAQDFMKTCLEFLDDQNGDMEKALGSATGADDAGNLLKGIRTMDEVIQLGYAIQLETATGQLARDPKMIEEAGKKFMEMENSLNSIQKAITKDTTISQLEDIRMAAANYKGNMKKMVANFSALNDLAKKRKSAGDAVSGLARDTAVSGILETTKSAAQVAQLLSRSAGLLFGGGILGLLVGMALSLLISRSITKPLNRIIKGLSEGAGAVGSAAEQVSSASQSFAQGSSEQAASIEETSSSLEEMSSMTRRNAENADQADVLIRETSKVVGQANESMKVLTGSMDEIARASEETSKIVKTIDEIAFQTNLLALNAAVEAARAGEAGAGFAVVAGEVRNLAMRAAEASRNTSDMIEKTVRKVREGSGLVKGTNEAFGKVADSTSRVAGLVGEIAAASREQAQGIEQVNRAVAEMDRVVQQNAAGAEENAGASEQMNSQAVHMRSYVVDLIAMVESRKNGELAPESTYQAEEDSASLDCRKETGSGLRNRLIPADFRKRKEDLWS